MKMLLSIYIPFSDVLREFWFVRNMGSEGDHLLNFIALGETMA